VTAKQQGISEGVRDAWDFWLSQHDVSVPEIIHGAVESAVALWLNWNTEQVIAAIARAVADKAPLDGPDERG
jgi:hypothetical protein